MKCREAGFRQARSARALVLGACLGLLGCGEEIPKPKNLLILSVDTLRADAIGAAGYPKARTPHIDRLVAEGTYFTTALAPIPRTTPALGSLLTGLWPQRHGSREVGDPIRKEVVTLAQILSRRGFATMAVSANDTAGPKQGLDRGFERFITYRDLIANHGDHLYRDLTEIPPDNPGWATVVTDQALALLRSTPSDRPFFLWTFYFDPHFLYRPPKPWQGEVAAERCWELYEYFQDHRGESGQVFSDVGGVATRALEDCRRLYDAEIAYTDAEIGRLLTALAEMDKLEETLILFVADHGENFGESGLFFEHGDNVHDAGLRVPFVWRGPGIASGRRDQGVVSLVDVLPTLLELLGVPKEERPTLDGVDLTPRLGSDAPVRAAERRVVFAESATAMWNEAVRHVTTGRTWWRVCINDERFSLCEIPHQEPGVYRLYDHVADPKLSRDVSSDHPAAVTKLRAASTRWPPETARERAAHTGRFKLVQVPQLEGGYATHLYDLEADVVEEVDVSERYPKVRSYLLYELERWATTLPGAVERTPDPELEATLRSLGYLE